MRTFFLLVLVAVLFREASSAPASAQITSLPGLTEKLNFDQYSGYIAISSERNLFYWFVESQGSPSTDPLILWLQGGPGCSGLYGLVTETGPFILNPDNTFTMNPYSWNTNANVIYLESPVGVGYSYTTGALYNGDNQTADDSWAFLEGWLQQYPEYQANDFYIMGESYGGHYVPQLATVILENNPSASIKVNLQGIMVGNAWSDIFYDSWSVPPFIYYHSLCSLPTYETVVEYCMDNSSLDFSVPFYEHKPRRLIGLVNECNQALDAMYEEVGPINNYDIYTPCYEGLKNDCTNNTGIQGYFNNPAVMSALHAKNIQQWLSCGDVNYTDQWRSVLHLYPNLMDNLHVVLYSGDVTYNVPAVGTANWIEDFGLPVTSPFQAWYLDGYVAGYYKKFQGITWATVLDAGHMVPQYQPGPAKELLNSYFNHTF